MKRMLRLSVVLVLVSPLLVRGGEAEALQQARAEFMANQFGKARETLFAFLTTNAESEDADVARVLLTEIPKGNGKKAAEPDVGPPQKQTPAVDAEQLRAQFQALKQKNKHADALDKMAELREKFPNQVSDMDVWQAVHLSTHPADTKAWLDFGAKQFPDSPLLAWAKTLPMHWQSDTVEAQRLLLKAEANLTEPLLSLERIHRLMFITGDVDNHNHLDVLKDVCHAVLMANRVDLGGAILHLRALRTVAQPQAAADWLAEASKDVSDPAEAALLHKEALKEYLQMGKVDAAKEKLAAWNAAPDAQALQDLLTKSSWTVEGTLPLELLKEGSGWHVALMLPSQPGENGFIDVTAAAKVDEQGRFHLDAASQPADALLAMAQRPSGIPLVRVLARNFKPNKEQKFVYTYTPPAPAVPTSSVEEKSGNSFVLTERFGVPWPKQLVQLHVPHEGPIDPAALRVTNDTGDSLPCQLLGQTGNDATVGVWLGLEPNQSLRLNFAFDGRAPLAAPVGTVKEIAETNETQIIDTGAAQFRIRAGTAEQLAATDAAKAGFIQGVKGPDGRWRGKMEWSGKAAPTKVSVRKAAVGPIRTSYACEYAFANGATRTVTLSFDAGQPVMLIDETGSGEAPGDFVFHLDPQEGLNTYYFLIRSSRSIEPLIKRTPTLGMSLKDYSYFSSPGNTMLGGFMSNDRKSKDALSFFVVHPGDWFDPSFTEAFKPLDEAPDEHWDHPARYTGSKNSAIHMSCQKDGDAPIHIQLAPGTRRWGIAIRDNATISDRDPKAVWEIQNLLFAYNQGDLSRYAVRVLDWKGTQDNPLRATVRQRLQEIVAGRDTGLLKSLEEEQTAQWHKQSRSNKLITGAAAGDPIRIYKGWEDILHHLQGWAGGSCRPESIHGLGIDPVGGRGVCEAYLGYLVADELGMLDDSDRAEVKRCAAYIAYHLLSPDFMNYKMNCGQPNFEADRLLQLAAFPAVFSDHPLAPVVREHVLKQTAEMLRQWTIRDGGKWAENIGAYYLHSLDCVARLCNYLRFSGPIEEITGSPYFEPFCRYASNMLMPPQPADGKWLKSDTFDAPTKYFRRVPGIGSHGGEGGNPVGCCVALIAQIVEKSNPGLAANLLETWNACGTGFDGDWGADANEFLLFGRADYGKIQEPKLAARRMPGWGMIFRDEVGTENEFYLAFHAGTPCYRDTYWGAGIILYALGKPLSLDGGDDPSPILRSGLLTKVNTAYAQCPEGKVTRWLISDAVQFAHGEMAQPNVTEQHFSRDVLYARRVSDQGGQYVVVHDEQNTRFPGVFNFTTPALKVEQKAEGIFCKGKLGVDLWLMPLAEKAPASEFEEVFQGNERVTRPNQWKQIDIRVPFEKASTVLLCPVKAGAAPVTATRLAENVWQIKGADFTDVLFTGDAQTEVAGVGAVKFQGALGLLRTANGTWNFSLLNGSAAQIGDKEVKSDQAATFYSDGRKVVEDNKATP